ncbi:MAG: Lanthionine synthetase family protein [Verrucomicrobiales bacterium]|nr:Lanthionine synthetase family protein [Verrucomicrobiales bacterium]
MTASSSVAEGRRQPVESQFSDEDLWQIVNRSATLHDRLSGRFIPANEALESASEIDDRLKRWQAVFGNNPAILDRRLQWEGHDRTSIRGLLGGVKLNDRELPSWALTLKFCITRTPALAKAGREAFLFALGSQPMPFEEVFFPYVLAGSELLERRTGQKYLRLMAGAREASQRGLLARLTSISSATLESEYTVFREVRASLWRLEAASLQANLNHTNYKEFVQSLLGDGLRAFFLRYPVLGRLVGTAVTLWLDSLEELIARLDRDLERISGELGWGKPTGNVAKLEIWLSDRHHGGRTVMLLTFESGLKVIYKPKCIALEKAFSEWLDWLAGQGLDLRFRPLRVVSMESYGWVECIAHRPCLNKAEAERYYLRAGMLLCVAHAMEATDCHHENIIAEGEFPQWVDLETLMQSPVRPQESQGNMSAPILASTLLAKSVLKTLLLPQWIFDNAGNSYDVSGLVSQSSSAAVPMLRNMNSDYMFLSYEAPKIKPLTNQPCLPDGDPLPASDFVEELIAGFRKMYRFLLERQELLSSPDGPLKVFAGQRIRFVLRPSRVYGLIMKRSLRPEFLRDGMDRSIQIDALAQPFARFGKKLPSWGTVETDHRSLEQMDVPYYSTYSDSRDLHWKEGAGEAGKNIIFPEYLSGQGFSEMLGHFRSMNESDLELQEQFIRTSFYAYTATEGASVPEFVVASEHGVDSDEIVTVDELLEEALLIGRQLSKTAIRASDGSAAWMGMNIILGTERYQFQAIGDSLFAGSTGVALFLAALGKKSGDAIYRDLALAAIQPIRATLGGSYLDLWSRGLGAGGFSGVPSVAYGFAMIGRLLGEESLLNDAIRVANSLSSEMVVQDKLRDVVLGTAGAVLALLVVYECTGERSLLESAISCGDKLLQERVSGGFGLRAWNTIRDRPLTGFSHGAAGIAYALFRLSHESGFSRFAEAAAEAVAFERNLFLPAQGNWPDLRFMPDGQGRPRCMVTWCHGASGIALSRLALGSMFGCQDFNDEAGIGMKTTHDAGSVYVDHLCCGKLGRAAILERGGRRLNRPDWRSRARGLTRSTIDAAREHKNYALFWNLPRTLPNPGLMQGVAGIGYHFLDFAESLEGRTSTLPEILLLRGSL